MDTFPDTTRPAAGAAEAAPIDERVRNEIAPLINVFGEMQWKLGRGVFRPPTEEEAALAFEAILSRATALAASPSAGAAPVVPDVRRHLELQGNEGLFRHALRLITAVEDRFGLEKARELAREALKAALPSIEKVSAAPGGVCAKCSSADLKDAPHLDGKFCRDCGFVTPYAASGMWTIRDNLAAVLEGAPEGGEGDALLPAERKLSSFQRESDEIAETFRRAALSPSGARTPDATTPEWSAMETAPKEAGRYITVKQMATFRWLPYRQGAEQLRKGIKGRWQQFNGYGWDNAELVGYGWKDAAIDSQLAEKGKNHGE